MKRGSKQWYVEMTKKINNETNQAKAMTSGDKIKGAANAINLFGIEMNKLAERIRRSKIIVPFTK